MVLVGTPVRRGECRHCHRPIVLAKYGTILYHKIEKFDPVTGRKLTCPGTGFPPVK